MDIKYTLVIYIALVIIFVTNVINGQQNSACRPPTSKRFASKTAYRNADTPASSQPMQIPDCKAIQIYAIFRHGTRYPSVSDVGDMVERVPGLRDMIIKAKQSGNSTLCQQDEVLLKTWKMNFNGSKTNHLHDEGRLEANAIAKRLRNRFPELFTQSYSPNVYQFRTSDTERTEETAKAFVKGLFDTEMGVTVSTKENDELLRFYKLCKRWESEVDDNDTALDEYSKFVHGPEVAEVGVRVSKRLGLQQPLSFYNISILWEMCRFETAWNRYPDGSSPWCNLFSDEDLDVLEYSEDLQYYWKEGYGYPINYQQSCPPLVNLFENFNSFKDPSKSGPRPAGLFHFTHSGFLLKFYARLNLFNDTKPLLGDEYHLNSDRKWRTSLIDPFGSNIAFVLFNCTERGTVPEGKLKVMAFVQEKEVYLANCTSTLCPLDTLMATYGTYANTCNLEQMCKTNSSAINSVSLYLLTFAIVLFAYNSIV